MKHLLLLMQKDLRLLRNTHFRTGKQVASFLAIAAVILLVAGLIVLAGLSWFRPLVKELPGEILDQVLHPLVLLVFIWLTMLFLFSTVQESKNKFFLTPDLALLVATPVNPLIIFTLRFLLFTCLNSSSFFQLSIFGLAPLIALGIVAAAPWYYYLLLLPLTYLYLLIPAALGVTLIMLLMRIFSPRRLFQLVAAGSGVLGILWFIFIFSDQQAVLTRLTTWLEGSGAVFTAAPPLTAVTDLMIILMGQGGGVTGPLLILLAAVVVVMTLAMLLMYRVYYYNYERLQVAERLPVKHRPDKKSTSRPVSYSPRSVLWFVLLNHWKMAVRNREMAQGAFGIIGMLAAYIFIMGTLVDDGSPLIMLINVAVVSFFTNLGIQLFFLPYAMITDHLVLNRQYWLLKTAPLAKSIAARSLFLANLIPALPLGLVVLFLVNYFSGIGGFQMLLSLAILVLVLASAAALSQLTTLLEAGSAGAEVSLPRRIMREVAPVLYKVIVLLPLAVGFFYRQLDFLSFMHPLPGGGVLFLSILLTLALSILVLSESLRRMADLWDGMEIK